MSPTVRAYVQVGLTWQEIPTRSRTTARKAGSRGSRAANLPVCVRAEYQGVHGTVGGLHACASHRLDACQPAAAYRATTWWSGRMTITSI